VRLPILLFTCRATRGWMMSVGHVEGRFARENKIATISAHRNWWCSRVNSQVPGRRSGGRAVWDALSSRYAGHKHQCLLTDWVLRGIPQSTREHRSGLALSRSRRIHRGLLHILDIRVGDMDGLHFRSVLDRRALYDGEPRGRARGCCGRVCHGAVSGIDVTEFR
jgi:hypothetical protein